MSETGMNEPNRTDELERRLEAYARARLSPSAASSGRMRTRVMAETQRRAARAPEGAAATGATGTSIQAGGTVVALRSRRRRSVTLALLAAALVLVGATGVAAAAQAGGPLYEVRLAIEEALLPAEGDARADAELERLEARLAEVRAAAGAGNQGAVAAALAAYRAQVDETTALLDSSDELGADLEAALQRHLDVLNALLLTVPEQARPGIERAIERSDHAVDQIHQAGGPANGPGAEPGSEPSATPGKPSHEPPGQTAKPDKTPRGGQPSHPPGGPPESSGG